MEVNNSTRIPALLPARAPPDMKKITLCADDFALSLSGSWRILDLIDLGRISAVSVMVQSPYWPFLAPELNAREQGLDVGLHFNLTHPFDGNARPLSHWLLPGRIRRSLKNWLRDRLLEQIDLYTAHFHRLPDFIDGHQHVHAFRVIRDALFEAIALRWRKTSKPYLHAPDRLGHSGGMWFKAGVLKATCVGFSGAARRRGYATPDWFAGLYPLVPGANFPQRMREWLANAPQDALLMCHPGDNETDDPVGRARSREYRYLSGPDFFDHCRENRTIITRFGADQGSGIRYQESDRLPAASPPE